VLPEFSQTSEQLAVVSHWIDVQPPPLPHPKPHLLPALHGPGMHLFAES
jgi:hypothetical protein